jgi:hypothetical protein
MPARHRGDDAGFDKSIELDLDHSGGGEGFARFAFGYAQKCISVTLL